MIVVKSLSLSYDNKKVLKGISFSWEGFYGLIGPNGSGKTTLLKVLLGILKPSTGDVLWNNNSLLKLTGKERAKKIAWIPQFYPEIRGLKVFDIIMLGRYPRQTTFMRESKRDIEIIKNILDLLNISSLAERYFSTLSGGERQKVMIAKALAQEPDILLADEPTAHLDFKNLNEIMGIFRRIKEEKNVHILSVFHNPFFSYNFVDGFILLRDGEIIDTGSKEKVINKTNISKLYQISMPVGHNIGTF